MAAGTAADDLPRVLRRCGFTDIKMGSSALVNQDRNDLLTDRVAQLRNTGDGCCVYWEATAIEPVTFPTPPPPPVRLPAVTSATVQRPLGQRGNP